MFFVQQRNEIYMRHFHKNDKNELSLYILYSIQLAYIQYCNFNIIFYVANSSNSFLVFKQNWRNRRNESFELQIWGLIWMLIGMIGGSTNENSYWTNLTNHMSWNICLKQPYLWGGLCGCITQVFHKFDKDSCNINVLYKSNWLMLIG